MPALALTVLPALLLALIGLVTGSLNPVAAIHLAFAAGALPLIFGAMLHFVPVLTRTGSAVKWLRALPWLAQGAGVLVVLTLQGILPRRLLVSGAGFDMLGAAVLLGWMVQRARRCLGRPHPGWRWYAAALVMLLLALLAIMLMFVWPQAYLAFYRAHLHFNTLGLIGLAALGTLPVLLPTVMNAPDSTAGHALHRFLPVAATGVLLIGLGSAVFLPLAGAGTLLLAWVTGERLHRWGQLYRTDLWHDGAALPLYGASVMWLILLLTAPWLHGRPVIAAFLVGFVLPLVTGSLSQLWPVWYWPGPVCPARLRWRQRLAGGGQWRAAGFFAGGLACLAGETATGAGVALAGIVLAGIRVVTSTLFREKSGTPPASP